MSSQNQTACAVRKSSNGATATSVEKSDQAKQGGVGSIGQSHSSLPAWLSAAITPEVLCNALRTGVPEFASGQFVLHHCAAKRLRFRESKGVWSGSYLLTIEGMTPGVTQVISLQGTLFPPGVTEAMPPVGVNGLPFGHAQWRWSLPELGLALCTQPPDTELAMLPQLTEPETARCLLETSIRSRGEHRSHYRDLRIDSCTPRVMRYKPGSRCTVLYHLDYPALPARHAWPTVVVAKTYNGDKGKNAFAGMEALWHSPLGASRTVAIAEPLAYLPALNVLVQGPIRQEMTLKELIRRALKASMNDEATDIMDELTAYVRKTAAGLAELHQCGVRYGEQVVWTDELAEIYQLRAGLAGPLPHLATLAEDLFVQLQRVAAVCPADPAAPAHRSFRPAQVLLHQGDIGFIDFDGFCQAEPAMDLALFMTTVKNIALNKPTQSADEDEDEDALLDPALRLARLTQAEAICALFLAEYETHAAVSHTRVMLWETLNLLSLVLGSWTKLKLARLENCLFLLERQVQAHGLSSDRVTG